MTKSPIIDRIKRWHDFAVESGRQLERILVHPDDYASAPVEYEGLSVVAMREREDDA